MRKWFFLTIVALFVLGISAPGLATWCPNPPCLPACGDPAQFNGSTTEVPVCIVVDEFVKFSFLTGSEEALRVTIDEAAFEKFLDPAEGEFADSNLVEWKIDANTNNFKVNFKSLGTGLEDGCNPLEAIGEYVKYAVVLHEDVVWKATGSYTAWAGPFWGWYWIPYTVHYSNPAGNGEFGIYPDSLEYDVNQMMGIQHGSLQVILEKEIGTETSVSDLPAGSYRDTVEITISPKS